jgi:hypothetical protein
MLTKAFTHITDLLCMFGKNHLQIFPAQGPAFEEDKKNKIFKEKMVFLFPFYGF